MKEYNLLHKLTINNNILKQKYRNIESTISKDNTLFILDWDDTLFPTSWAMKNGINISNNGTRNGLMEHFKELDRTVSNFLKHITKYGKVIIITNATKEWIMMSSIVLPLSYNIIDKNINVISARSLFENVSKSNMEWKEKTFQMVINREFENKNTMNVISMGDAEYEHQALVSLTKTNLQKIKFLKSFRFIRDPTYEQITEQIDLINNHIDKMWNKHKQLCKTFSPHN